MYAWSKAPRVDAKERCARRTLSRALAAVQDALAQLEATGQPAVSSNARKWRRSEGSGTGGLRV